jgi:2-polyprenyl-3-methyl-5-hydroxy-6-metoxy-1,4-benzoquinol methylase
MGEADSYKISAKYYDDAYASAPNLVDLPFYLELARRIGGPVLELGCGTGRVLLPIARAGIEIHGLDGSASMLRILQEHIQCEPTEVQRRIVLYEGDMRTFSWTAEISSGNDPLPADAAHVHGGRSSRGA